MGTTISSSDWKLHLLIEVANSEVHRSRKRLLAALDAPSCEAAEAGAFSRVKGLPRWGAKRARWFHDADSSDEAPSRNASWRHPSLPCTYLVAVATEAGAESNASRGKEGEGPNAACSSGGGWVTRHCSCSVEAPTAYVAMALAKPTPVAMPGTAGPYCLGPVHNVAAAPLSDRGNGCCTLGAGLVGQRQQQQQQACMHHSHHTMRHHHLAAATSVPTRIPSPSASSSGPAPTPAPAPSSAQLPPPPATLPTPATTPATVLAPVSTTAAWSATPCAPDRSGGSSSNTGSASRFFLRDGAAPGAPEAEALSMPQLAPGLSAAEMERVWSIMAQTATTAAYAGIVAQPANSKVRANAPRLEGACCGCGSGPQQLRSGSATRRNARDCHRAVYYGLPWCHGCYGAWARAFGPNRRKA